MHCWHCLSVQDLPNKKVGFRAVCETCGRDLHICKNCKFYSIGKPNDCLVPNTDYIADRESFNFCEEFAPSQKIVKEKEISQEDVENKLFKKKNSNKKNKGFDSLFND